METENEEITSPVQRTNSSSSLESLIEKNWKTLWYAEICFILDAQRRVGGRGVLWGGQSCAHGSGGVPGGRGGVTVVVGGARLCWKCLHLLLSPASDR